MTSGPATAEFAARPELRVGGLLLGGAVVLLLAGVFVFDRARVARIGGERALAAARVELAEARSREQLAQHNGALLKTADAVQQHAQLAAVLPRYWSERQINLRQQNLQRAQVNTLLQSIGRSSAQLLKSEEFDLAVTHPDEGLFDPAPGSRYALMLSLRGSLYFRISDKPL